MSPATALRQWWLARDTRERRMLAVMLAAVAAFLYWYGLVGPLRAMRDAQRQQYDQSVTQWRDARAAATAIDRHVGDADAGDRDDLAREILGSATAAGIPVDRQRRPAGGGVSIEADSVPVLAVFAWLDALQRDHGVTPTALELRRTPDGVAIGATFGDVR